MSLLTPQQVTDVFAALKTVTDTFFTIPCQLFINTEGRDNWNEERVQITENAPVTVNCLAVYEQTGPGAMAEVLRQGTYSFDRGYCLFYAEDLQAQGLIDVNGTSLMQATRDYLQLPGERFKIMGINPVGYFVSRTALVKIHIERDFHPYSPQTGP